MSTVNPKWKDLAGTNKTISIEDASNASGENADLWDTNGDGVINKSEFDNGLKALKKFNTLDTNGDGILTVDDFTGTDAQKQKKLDAQTKKYDKDSDGKVSKEEMIQTDLVKKAPTFAELDKDKNSSLSADDLKKRFGNLDFTKWDLNGDGKIDKNEFTKGSKLATKYEALLKKYDKNNDKTITKEEMGNAWKNYSQFDASGGTITEDNFICRSTVTFWTDIAGKEKTMAIDKVSALAGVDANVWDANGDGVISKAEYNKGNAEIKKLKKLDKTGDYTITKDDMSGKDDAAKTKAFAKYSKYDANADGMITAEELAGKDISKSKPKFEELDKDGDKAVTAEDLKKRFGTLDYTQWDQNGDGKIDAKEYNKFSKYAIDFEAKIKSKDKNADSILTQDEMPSEWKAAQKKFDTNGDNKITEDEYIKGQAIAAQKAAAAAAAAATGTKPAAGNASGAHDVNGDGKINFRDI